MVKWSMCAAIVFAAAWEGDHGVYRDFVEAYKDLLELGVKHGI